jgi:hypothetical protein
VRKMRFAHFPHHTNHSLRGFAARTSGERGRAL